MARPLQSRSYVMGPAFGFFGELGREVSLYTGEAAKVRSRVPGGFGWCYGPEQAKSIAVPWARGRRGRVASRKAAVMVDAAFELALWNRARSPKYVASAAPATWNEWDESGNLPHVSFCSIVAPWPRGPMSSPELETR